jgi:hypothetical protein
MHSSYSETFITIIGQTITSKKALLCYNGARPSVLATFKRMPSGLILNQLHILINMFYLCLSLAKKDLIPPMSLNIYLDF